VGKGSRQIRSVTSGKGLALGVGLVSLFSFFFLLKEVGQTIFFSKRGLKSKIDLNC